MTGTASQLEVLRFLFWLKAGSRSRLGTSGAKHYVLIKETVQEEEGSNYNLQMGAE